MTMIRDVDNNYVHVGVKVTQRGSDEVNLQIHDNRTGLYAEASISADELRAALANDEPQQTYHDRDVARLARRVTALDAVQERLTRTVEEHDSALVDHGEILTRLDALAQRHADKLKALESQMIATSVRIEGIVQSLDAADAAPQPEGPAPCPWCGSEEIHVYGVSRRWAECSTCGARGSHRGYTSDAIVVWNRVAKAVRDE